MGQWQAAAPDRRGGARARSITRRSTAPAAHWNLYHLDYTQETYQVFGDLVISAAGLPASATGIPTLAANTTKGHLIEIGRCHEAAWAYRLSNFTGGWIGLTDNETYGGQEAGNAVQQSDEPNSSVLGLGLGRSRDSGQHEQPTAAGMAANPMTPAETRTPAK